MNYEQREIDEEREELDRAAALGASDARSNLASDPSRHCLACLNASAYRRSFEAEVAELIRVEERHIYELNRDRSLT
jgi:hypothetical protein